MSLLLLVLLLLVMSCWFWTGFTVPLFIIPVLYLLLERRSKVGEDNLDVLVVGAGISGISICKRLNDIGVRRYRVVEQGGALGGTWYWNQYPGCACDFPAISYSFSWFYNNAWTKKFPGANEIQEYLARAASSQNITSHVEFNKTVVKCEWLEDEGKWRVDTSDGAIYTANVLVNASGMLHKPHVPKFEGDDKFRGLKIHTARWDKSVDWKGKKVGLIGTGCSGVQVLPALIDDCQQMTLIQRSPAWVIPKGDEVYKNVQKSKLITFPIDWILRKIFYYIAELHWITMTTKDRWFSLGDCQMAKLRAMMESTVQDPVTREKIIPKYGLAVKRFTFSDDYLQAFNKNNFKLVTDSIKQFNVDGIETVTGEKIKLDAIIYATGFDCFQSAVPFEILGENGSSLASMWGGSPRAYKGMCVPKMPNFFIMFGPSTISDRMFFSECAADFVADAVLKLSKSGKKSMVVKEEVFKEYNRKLKEAVKTKIYSSTAGGYYEDEEGFNWQLYPYCKDYYWWQTRRCGKGEFVWK